MLVGSPPGVVGEEGACFKGEWVYMEASRFRYQTHKIVEILAREYGFQQLWYAPIMLVEVLRGNLCQPAPEIFIGADVIERFEVAVRERCRRQDITNFDEPYCQYRLSLSLACFHSVTAAVTVSLSLSLYIFNMS